jgi:gamma-glutamyltranspeptidase
MQPAIDLAEKGFAVPAALHLNLRSAAKRLGRNEEANRVYLGGVGDSSGNGRVIQAA